jgi:hypothetical protein
MLQAKGLDLGQFPAIYGRSPMLSRGRSNVGSAQAPNIQVQTRSGKSPAIRSLVTETQRQRMAVIEHDGRRPGLGQFPPIR